MSPLLIGSSDLAPDWAAATLATTFASVVPQSNSTRAHGHHLLNPRVRRCVSPAHLVDRTPTHSTHLCSTVCSKARNAHHALGSRLKNCITSLCAWKESVIWSAHVSPFVGLSPATSTSSSSFTLPSISTPEHAAQSGQHDLLQEHPVHNQPLQAFPVDKQRHQESLWRENLQSGGNTRTTTPT